MRDEWEGKVKRMIQIYCILSCFCLFEKFCHFVDPWNAGSLTSIVSGFPVGNPLSFLSRMTHSNYQQHALSSLCAKNECSRSFKWCYLITKLSRRSKNLLLFLFSSKENRTLWLPSSLTLSTKVHSLFLPSFPCPCLDNGSLIYNLDLNHMYSSRGGRERGDGFARIQMTVRASKREREGEGRWERIL